MRLAWHLPHHPRAFHKLPRIHHQRQPLQRSFTEPPRAKKGFVLRAKRAARKRETACGVVNCWLLALSLRRPMQRAKLIAIWVTQVG
jgi:hypothetical protein